MRIEELSPALPDSQRKRYFWILQIIHILAWVIMLLPLLTEFAVAAYYAGTDSWFGNGRLGFGTTFWHCIAAVGFLSTLTGSCYYPSLACCIGALLLKRGARKSASGTHPDIKRFRIMTVLSVLCLAGGAFFLIPIVRIAVFAYASYMEYFGGELDV